MRPARNPFETSFQPGPYAEGFVPDDNAGDLGLPLASGMVGAEEPGFTYKPMGQPMVKDAHLFDSTGEPLNYHPVGKQSEPIHYGSGEVAVAPGQVVEDDGTVPTTTTGTTSDAANDNTPAATRARAPMVGHMGGLPPIAPQYSQWESVEELNAAYDEAKAELRQKAFFGGEMTLDQYREAESKLEQDRAAAVAQQEAFEGSIPGQELALARTKLATDHEQQEFEAQVLDRQAWEAQMRALQTKDARRKLDQSAKDAERRRMRIEARIEGEMLSYKNALRDLETTKIDPYGSRTTGDKIAAAIAVGLGALGQGLSGQSGPNPALGMIQAQIDREVQAQIASLENKKAGLAGRTTLVGMLRERLGDVDAAAAAAKAHIYDQLDLRMKTVKETANSQILEIRAEKLRTHFSRKKQEFEMAYALQAHIKAEQLEQQRAAAIAYARQAQAKQAMIDAELQASLGNESGQVIDIWTEGDFPKGARYVEAVGGIVGAGGLADKTIEKINASKEVERLANEIKRQGKVGWENMARKEQLTAAFTAAYSKAKGLGALDEGTIGIATKIVGNPNIPWGEAEARAQQVIAQTQRERRDMINSLGVIPARQILRTDQKSGKKKVRYAVIGRPRRVSTNPVTTE